MSGSPDSIKMTKKADAITGQRFCTNCYRHTRAEGGGFITTGNGRKRWIGPCCMHIYRKHNKERVIDAVL